MEKQLLKTIDTSNAEHYYWGDHCEGWHLVKTDDLSIIREKMPAMTKEVLHYHEKAEQFFYILSGEADFEIDGVMRNLAVHSGIHVKPGLKHRIFNNLHSDLEFLVISRPKSHGDRVCIE